MVPTTGRGGRVLSSRTPRVVVHKRVSRGDDVSDKSDADGGCYFTRVTLRHPKGRSDIPRCRLTPIDNRAITIRMTWKIPVESTWGAWSLPIVL